jgi:hypothetical protein
LGLSQAGTKHWLPRLWPGLRDALTTLGGMPERNGGRVARAERRPPEPQAYLIEGTERRRHRPQEPEKPGLY